MRKFSGTKGGWKVQHSQSKTAYNVVGTVLGGKYKVARCPYIKDETLSDAFNQREEQEAKADARLIAAAPELLEALQALMEGVRQLPPLSAIAGVLESQYKQAQAAISKALGDE